MRALIILASLFLLCKGQHVEIRCHFRLEPFDFYRCIAGEFVITQNKTRTVIIVGHHWPNLTNLDVTGVDIFDQPIPFIISECFTTFPNLRVLNIFGGLLSIQDDAFRFAQNLSFLTISNSSLRVLPANFLRGATSLQNFLISDCDELEKIDQNAFYGLNHLLRINILRTSIRFLPENVFSTLSNLTSVQMFDNEIRTLPAKLFHNNLGLEDIFLLNNHVHAVGSSFVDNFVNLTKLHLFIFIGNTCGNSNVHPSNITAIHTALQECYRNYEQRRHFQLELQGSLVIRDENGNVIFDAHV